MARVAPEVPDAGAVWSAEDTTPSDIEDALRQLLQEQHAREGAHAPARVLNLVVVVDREWRGEIMNRLEQVGRYHASRTILCTVEGRRDTIDASVVMTVAGESQPGELMMTRERVILELGEKHLRKLDTIVDPLVVTDLPTVVWAPHGHAEAVAWLRPTPWRERVAATFDPPRWREELPRIDGVTVRHRPESTVAGLLFCGWLASRLGWEPGTLMPVNGSVRGRAHGKRDDVALVLEPHEGQTVPGLAGVEIHTSSGMVISLDRGPGGLVARRRDQKGR